MHAEINPFQVEDGSAIKARHYEHEIDIGFGETNPHFAIFAKFPSWTAWVDGQPAFAAGFLIMWPGVAEVWARTSEWVQKHPIYFHKTVKRYLEETVRINRLWRVQVVIPVANRQSNRWIQHLDFSWEGRCWHLGPRGEDFERYARIWREYLPNADA